MDKKQAVSALAAAADVLELLGEEGFRVSAFRAAARALENLAEPFEDVLARGFRGVPKIGGTLGEELRELARTGALPSYQAAAEQLPPGVLELFRVRGLGPKKIRLLWLSGIASLEKLREACLSGQVAAIKGFGAKSQATILENVEFALSAQGRFRLGTAFGVADQVMRALDGLSPRISGSLRRGLETVGDVDLTATGTREEVRGRLEGLLENLGHAEYPAWRGEVNGVPVEVGYGTAATRGAVDLTFMGGAYRDVIFKSAKEQNLTLDSNGLTRDNEVLPTPTERDVFALLNLPYRPPEYREAEHLGLEDLPPEDELIKADDILGLLHTHSTWSDGAASIREMAGAVRDLGPGMYLGTGDHSGNAFYANGLGPERLREQLREVRALQAEGLPLIAGAEVDILEDGALDYPDELLKELDYVVASVHSHFNLDAVKQTERLIRAVSHPLITILGHPTGRLLLRRPPYALDLDAVLEAAVGRGTVIEINANPARLDLDWRGALRWRGQLKFAINTDAHVPDGLGDLRSGVAVARKAGLTKGDVVNCLPRTDFLAFVQKQRAGRG